MFVVYTFGLIAWLISTGALWHFPSIRYSFYITASAVFLSGISLCYYFQSLADIKRKRLIIKLVRDSLS